MRKFTIFRHLLVAMTHNKGNAPFLPYLSLMKYFNFIKPSRSPEFPIEVCSDKFFFGMRIPKFRSAYRIFYFCNVSWKNLNSIFLQKKIFFHKKSQKLPQSYIYACSEIKIIILVMSAPENAVKNFKNFVKSPIGEVGFRWA